MSASLNTFLRKIAADTTVSFGLKLLAVPVGYLTPLIIARLYGAEQMGTFSIAAYLVMATAVFCRLGLDTGLMRFVAVLSAQGQVAGIWRLFWLALSLVGGFSVLAAVGMHSYGGYLAQYFHAPQLTGIIGFAALALPLAVAASMCGETLRALGRVRWVIFQHNLLTPLAFVVLASFFAYLGYGFQRSVQSLGLSFLLSTLLGLAVLVAALSLFPRSSETGSGSHGFQDLMRYSWPLFLSSLLMLSFVGLDSLILAWYTSPAKVAYYEAAAKTSTLIGFPLVVVNAVVPPLFAQFHQLGNLLHLETVAQSTARWTYYLALPLTLMSCVLAPELLGFFGPGFPEGQWALRLLVTAQLVSVACGSVGLILAMTGHQWTFAILQASAGAIGVPLMALATAAYGLTGLALARGLWLIGLNIITSLAVWRHLGIRAHAKKVQWANFGGFLGLTLYFLTSPFIGPVGGAVFFIGAYLSCTLKTLKHELEEILHSAPPEAAI